MAKKKAGEPQRELTKRQLSRWQQQEKRQRIIFSLGIFIIVAVFGIVGAGWYITQYQPMHQTVIKVNGVELNMNYYVKMLRYYGQSQPNQFVQAIADEMVKIIEKTEIVRQEALKLGISVSDDEIDKELNSYKPPLSKDYRDIIGAQMLLDKLNDEYFDKQVPMFAEQRRIMAMLLENEHQAAEVRARLEAGEDFAKLAGELSLESSSKTNGGDLDWRPKGMLSRLLGTSVPDEYAFSAEVGVLSQPVHDEVVNKMMGYWLVKLLKRDEGAKQALVQVILLGSEEEARDIRARLDAGEDFAKLAKEFSQHIASKDNGGNFDVTSPDMISPALNNFIFDSKIELETLSQPIRDDTIATEGGYWLLKVMDKNDSRQIEDVDREFLKTEALNKWIEAQVNNPENKVESYLDDAKKAWAINQALAIWN